MENLEIVRIYNAIAASVLLILLLRGALKNWVHWRQRLRMITISYILIVATAVWGSLEQALRGTPTGSRTVMTAIAISYGLVAMLWAERDVHPSHEEFRK